MAKFYGPIGFSETVEKSPGNWTNQDVEREYFGDIIRNTNRWSSSPDGTNGELNIDNQISIVADPYAENHFHSMRYVEFMGTRWSISKVEVRSPRLILTLGGRYNG